MRACCVATESKMTLGVRLSLYNAQICANLDALFQIFIKIQKRREQNAQNAQSIDWP